jgi:hypothetical protein
MVKEMKDKSFLTEGKG